MVHIVNAFTKEEAIEVVLAEIGGDRILEVKKLLTRKGLIFDQAPIIE